MVAMREIREFSRRIAAEFKPRRIILFGSYAYGRPRKDSDVDLLVIMPYQGRDIDNAIEIRKRLNPRFALDLIVRSPAEVARRVAINDWFMRDIVEDGLVLYEADDTGVGAEGRSRLGHRKPRGAGKKGAQLRRSVLSRSAVRGKVPQSPSPGSRRPVRQDS